MELTRTNGARQASRDDEGARTQTTSCFYCNCIWIFCVQNGCRTLIHVWQFKLCYLYTAHRMLEAVLVLQKLS